MAGSTNFVQHNPTEANQLDDAAFDANSLTTGGIGTDNIMPSNWMNKRWYQDSTMVAALAQMLANKGYTVSDANISTLIAVLANLVTQSDLKLPLVSVAYSPTPVFDGTTTNGFDFVMAGNVTSSTLVNVSIGQTLVFIIAQGSTPFTFVPPANINGWQSINPVANSVTVQTFIVREDGTIWPAPNTSVSTLPRGQFTLPGGTLSGGSQFIYDTGIAISNTQVPSVSVLSGTISPILVYATATFSGFVRLVVSNDSSSTISYGPLVYNYVIL